MKLTKLQLIEAFEHIRELLADEETIHVTSELIEWFDDQIEQLEGAKL